MTGAMLEIVATTLQVALVATLLVFVPSILLAYLLARHEFVGKSLVASFVALPMVLPPTLVGVLLLRLFATNGPLGERALGFDLDLVLSWRGAALASAVMSAPLVVRTARVAFEEVDPSLEAIARTLGHSKLEAFFRFTLPMARRGLLASIVLGFTRALGEYGATVTIAGSIPGSTRTIASAIVAADQVGDQFEMTKLAILSIAIGFAAIVVTEQLSRARVRR